MTDINTIKNLRNNHDKSINEIAETLKINWLTAKKYADNAILPKENTKKKSRMMYDEDYPVFKEIMVRANKLNEIKLDNTLIHIHNSWRHGNLYAYLTSFLFTPETND